MSNNGYRGGFGGGDGYDGGFGSGGGGSGFRGGNDGGFGGPRPAVPSDYVRREQELDELWENNISSGINFSKYDNIKVSIKYLVLSKCNLGYPCHLYPIADIWYFVKIQREL